MPPGLVKKYELRYTEVRSISYLFPGFPCQLTNGFLSENWLVAG